MRYYIKEDDILSTVRDFTRLCEYIGGCEPPITKKSNLSPKACFEANDLMSNPRKTAKPTDHMPKYEAITLFWKIAITVGFVRRDAKIASKPYVTLTERYDSFKQMNPCTQYLLIFASWMFSLDIYEAYEDDLYENHFRGYDIDYTFHFFGKMKEPEWISITSRIFNVDPIHILSNMYTLVHHLSDFGLVDYKLDEKKGDFDKYPRVIKISPTKAGIELMRSCETRRFTWLNAFEEPMAQSEDDQIIYQNDFEQLSPMDESFWKPFTSCFPENMIDYRVISGLLFGDTPENDTSTCVLRFKVQLKPKCYRIINCAGTHTFEDLHIAIQQAFDFDDDHLYVFYPDGSRSSRRSRRGIYSPYCEDSGQLSAGDIRLCDLHFYKGQRLTYLFDFGDEWEFTLTLMDIYNQAVLPIRPEIVESVGSAPPQYEQQWGEYD